MKKEKTIAGAIGGCLALIIIYGSLGVIEAWLLMIVWNFIVPSFFHGPSLPYLPAAAFVALVSLIVGFFKSSN